ncbi:MAG: response regulator [Betaproteobacteria bacterium]|nr:response regulator [Betaproteobacteria bacterium]
MSKIRVLVVDDDNLMRQLLKAILNEEGYQVVGEARDGASALPLVDKLRPELVCLDVNMPGLSGVEVLKLIQERVPGTKVVMITGDSSMTTVREVVSYGALGYIIKPFNQARVASAIKAALKGPSDSPFN